MPRLLVATRNAGKLRELRRQLAQPDLELIGLDAFPHAPEVEENGDSYETNAALKALAMARYSGLPALGDDSGLEVEALGGAPGIRSARYAGAGSSDQANVALLLRRLQGVPPERRGAHFRCVMVVAQPSGARIAAEGSCQGVILPAARGSRGFGYDPVFFHPPLARGFAELSEAAKDAVSHRGIASRRLREQLLSFLKPLP